MPTSTPLAILRPIPSRMVSTAFVLATASEVVVVDTGAAGNAPMLTAALQSLDRPTTALNAILLTHCHPDHTGSLADLAAATGAPVYAQHLDASLIEAGTGGRTSVPKPDPFSRFLFKRIVLAGPQQMAPCAVTHRLEGGETLSLCGGIDVVPLPGHTIGHVGYRHRPSGHFFVGDALMSLFGPRRTRWHEDMAAETKSLATIASLEWTTLHVAHGAPISRAAFMRRTWD